MYNVIYWMSLLHLLVENSLKSLKPLLSGDTVLKINSSYNPQQQ